MPAASSTPTRRRKSSPAREKPVSEEKAAKVPAAAKEPEFEFGGPVGALGVIRCSDAITLTFVQPIIRGSA